MNNKYLMNIVDKTKMVIKVIGHLLFVCGLVILIILPTNKYSWMRGMDPSIMVEDSSDNRMIFSLIILIIISLIELMIAMRSANIIEKRLSLILVFVAVLLWSTNILGCSIT